MRENVHKNDQLIAYISVGIKKKPNKPSAKMYSRVQYHVFITQYSIPDSHFRKVKLQNILFELHGINQMLGAMLALKLKNSISKRYYIFDTRTEKMSFLEKVFCKSTYSYRKMFFKSTETCSAKILRGIMRTC